MPRSRAPGADRTTTSPTPARDPRRGGRPARRAAPRRRLHRPPPRRARHPALARRRLGRARPRRRTRPLGDVEGTTKGRKVRYVPLGDQALGALDRLSRRPNFTGADDYVFANVAGDRLDPSALRRRYIAARDAAGLPPLRFHDLRHTAGTLLTRVLDPVTVRDVLGHADLKTTERYLHAVRASRLSDAATRAFTPERPTDPGRGGARRFTRRCRTTRFRGGAATVGGCPVAGRPGLRHVCEPRRAAARPRYRQMGDSSAAACRFVDAAALRRPGSPLRSARTAQATDDRRRRSLIVRERACRAANRRHSLLVRVPGDAVRALALCARAAVADHTRTHEGGGRRALAERPRLSSDGVAASPGRRPRD